MPSKVSLTIVLGIVSGIITTALLYLAGIVFTKIIIPWYQKIIYQGVDLNGEWKFERQLNNESEIFRLSLVQNANSISGQLTYLRINNEETREVNYLLNGSVWEGYLTLNMKSKDRRAIAYATSLLKVERGGRELKGNHCFRNFRTDQVDSTDLLYTRA
jgi:hypothetical protein